MSNNTMKEGIILGLERIGCRLIKEDSVGVYFDIPNNIDEGAIKAFHTVLFDKCGLRLFKRVTKQK